MDVCVLQKVISKSQVEEQAGVTSLELYMQVCISNSFLELVTQCFQVSEKLICTAFSLDQKKFRSYLCK